jgi:alpha/beta superfamily hydrolase
VALAGYSFGAAVAAAVAADTPIGGLALIAPPLRIMPLIPPAVSGPFLIVVGAEDQYCPPASLETIRDAHSRLTWTVIDGADHFFFGAQDALGASVEGWAAALAAP